MRWCCPKGLHGENAFLFWVGTTVVSHRQEKTCRTQRGTIFLPFCENVQTLLARFFQWCLVNTDQSFLSAAEDQGTRGIVEHGHTLSAPALRLRSFLWSFVTGTVPNVTSTVFTAFLNQFQDLQRLRWLLQVGRHRAFSEIFATVFPGC